MKKLFKIKVLTITMILIFSGSDLFSQWNYGQSFSNLAPSSGYKQVQNKQLTTFMYDSLSKPYPTNSWFTNLILPYGAWGTTLPIDYNKVGYFGAYAYPYCVGFAWNHPGNLHTSPYQMLKIDYAPFKVNHFNDTGTVAVTWSNAQVLFLGTRDSVSIKPFLKSYDDFSATVRWRSTASPNSGYMEAPLVRGMPYVSMYYHNFRPLVAIPSPNLVSVNGINVSGIHDSTDITGKSFKLVLNGDTGTKHRQIWILYATQNISLRFKYDKIICTDPSYEGYIRLAYITTRGYDSYESDSTIRMQLTDKYAKFVPTGGTFNASINTDTAHVAMTFNFKTNMPSNDSLLMLALPHHISMISNPMSSILKFRCNKGQMTDVYGKTWYMTETLPDLSWYSPNGGLNNVPAIYRDSLLNMLKYDVDSLCGTRVFPYVHNGTNTPSADMYGFGKTSAKIGRLAIIGDELLQWYPVCDTLSGAVRDTLKYYINAFLNGKPNPHLIGVNKPDTIFYDNLYGGMISSLSYENGYYDDFGNALYNDHHFHYGYFLYTAAAIARKDAGWATAYKEKVLALARDIANPSSSDIYFPRNRMLDWYDGNSWAKGMEGTGAGRNQESSSEATNAWYGLYLYGLATGDQNIKNTGKIMLASEIRAAKYYYHIDSLSNIYPSSYTNSWKIVGNLWNAAIDNQTFFGKIPRYVYGIHIIPVTPATRKLWEPSYGGYVYRNTPMGTDSVFGQFNTPTRIKNWTTICFPIQAMADKDKALSYFHTYSGFNGNFDGGASKTNTYYWLITYKFDLLVGVKENKNELSGKLFQNVPNPFIDKTNITYQIAEAGNYRLDFYDMNGIQIGTPVNSYQVPGLYNVTFFGGNLTSGTYYYRLSNSKGYLTEKMILLK
jgi:endo-1,3(4)-beta-glucanase